MKASETARNALHKFLSELAGMPYVACLAMNYRLASLQKAGALDRYELPEGMKFEMPEPEMEFRFKEFQEWSGYLLFEDGSLYCISNAENEVWSSALDFVDEVTQNYGADDEYLSADKELIGYLFPDLRKQFAGGEKNECP